MENDLYCLVSALILPSLGLLFFVVSLAQYVPERELDFNVYNA